MAELIHKRKWDSKTFDTGRIDEKENPVYATILQNGLHDVEPDGSFIECNPLFQSCAIGVSTDRVIRSRCGEVRISDIGSESKDLAKIKTKNKCGISFKLKGHRTYGPHFNNLKSTYYTTNDGVTLEYYPNYKGINIVIVIDNPQTAANIYRFSLKEYGCTYTYEETEDGIKCISSTDKDNIYIRAVYVKDANDDYGTVNIKLGDIVDGFQEIEKIIDPVWLGNAVGPVESDPSVTIEDGVDGGVIEEALMVGGDTRNFGVRINMNCNDYTGVSRQNWVVKTDLSGEDSGRTVTFAKYIFYCDGVVGSPFAVKFWPLLREWVEGTKDGASESGSVCGQSARYTIEDWTADNASSAGNDYDNTTPTASLTSPSATGFYDVTCDNSIIQARLGTTNKGDVVHPVTIAIANAFRTQTSEDTNHPQFYYEYTEAVGGGFPFFFDSGHY